MKLTKTTRLLGSMNRSTEIFGLYRRLRGTNFALRNADTELPPRCEELRTALSACRQEVNHLEDLIAANFEVIARLFEEPPLNDSATVPLLALNRRLVEVTGHLQSVKDDQTPRLEAKLADSGDPIFDYEIEAQIHYILSKDDQEYDEADDNVLSTRTEDLKLLSTQDFLGWDDESARTVSLESSIPEPQCWLFHDLLVTGFGSGCPRIGRIGVDVQAWQQYYFDVPTASFVKVPVLPAPIVAASEHIALPLPVNDTIPKEAKAMKPKVRTTLNNLANALDDSLLHLRRITRTLRGTEEALPFEIAEKSAALKACQESIQGLYEKVGATLLRSIEDEAPLTDAEIDQLLALNQRLKAVGPFLKSIADDVTPRLEAKLANPNDPMVDYEIEVLLDFVLREDDPDFDEDDDNILTRRRESLKRQFICNRADFTPPWGPPGLQAEPHCGHFRDLYDSAYGAESPRLSYRDCLRIGSIWIDVQVWHQYDFDLTERSVASN